MEITLTSEKVFARSQLEEGSTLVDFRFEFLAMLLDGKNARKAAEVRQEKTFLMNLFKRIDNILRIDRRGIHAAKPDLIKANIKDLYNLLSDEDKADIRQELAKENSHATTAR